MGVCACVFINSGPQGRGVAAEEFPSPCAHMHDTFCSVSLKVILSAFLLLQYSAPLWGHQTQNRPEDYHVILMINASV